MSEGLGEHWRNTARSVRFFAFDARAAAPLLLFILHMQLWTLILAVIVIILFAILERFGLTINLAVRRARVWLIGEDRPALTGVYRREFTDRG